MRLAVEGGADALGRERLLFGTLHAGLALVTGTAFWITQASPETPMAVYVPCAILGVLLSVVLIPRGLHPERRGSEDRHATIGDGARGGSPASHTVVEGRNEVDVLAALRHEFRTPLNAVLGFSDVLLGEIDGAIEPSQREDLEIIRASGIKLRVLLDSALDLSQLATGDLRTHPERVDAREVVERACREASQLWPAKRELRVSLAASPCSLVADEARLRRCIVVLADFLASHHRQSTIEVELNRSNDHLVVSVSALASGRLTLDSLPTPEEVVSAEDPMKVRQWPVAVASEIIQLHEGSLYHGDDPARFVVRVPTDGPR